MIILIICLIAMLLGFVFSTFPSGEESGSGQGNAISEIQAYQEAMGEIKRQGPHDMVGISSA